MPVNNCGALVFDKRSKEGAESNISKQRLEMIWDEVQKKNWEKGLGWKAPNAEKQNDHKAE